MFSIVSSEGLLGQLVTTISAHQPVEFPKNVQQKVANEVMCNAVELRSSALSAANPEKIPVTPESLALMIMMIMRRRLSDWQGGRETNQLVHSTKSIVRDLRLHSFAICLRSA